MVMHAVIPDTGKPAPILNTGGTGGGGVLVETSTLNQRHNRYETGIGYAAGTVGEIPFLQSENVRRYRCKPSADMRVVEDAANVAQAEAWLNTGNARLVSTTTDVEYLDLVQDVWSEWQELSKDPNDLSLSNLWLSLDAAGTGATVVVEAE